MSGPDDVTVLLSAWRGGDEAALERLLPLVYKELRRLAASYMRRERQDHTLQPTALVNEAYLRLANEPERTWENRAHFFGVAARIMRNLLVDHARANSRTKRGGAAERVQLPAEAPDLETVDADEILAIDQALDRLKQVDPRASRIVELRYFVGLTNEEVAEVIGASEKTVKRDWSTAKAWLRTELRANSG